jgi:hypothetical protein
MRRENGMKVTRTHIVVIIVLSMVVITLNAIWRVRYFGQKEREWQEAHDAGDAASE